MSSISRLPAAGSPSAVNLFSESVPATLNRLVGHHPGAVRTVCWSPDALSASGLHHLELETKHGQVVVIDHVSGECYSDPPQPPQTLDGELLRQQRDLSAMLPGVFDGRPTFSRFVPLAENDSLTGWRIDLSNGRSFTLLLDGQTPLILPDDS
jgi:hypothetical protein